MKRNGKLLIALLCCSMLAGLTACNSSDQPIESQNETTAAVTDTATDTVHDEEMTVTDTAAQESETETIETVAPEKARLEELFSNKTDLRFDENGEFRVMILSDLHIPASGLPGEVIGYIRKIIDKEDPDFVILNGDNVVDSSIENQKTFQRALKSLTSLLETKGIYWMHVFGNHDGEMKFSMEEQQTVYESYDYCLSKDTEKALTGVGNYVIPIYGSTDDEVKFVLWGIDSGSYLSDEDKQAFFPQGITGYKGYDGTGYDYIHFDQIEWYREVSELMESQLGHKIPGIMSFHIPLQEFYSAWENHVGSADSAGSRNEAVCSSAYNSGLFEQLRQRGDVKAVICGHDHVNDFMVNYGGIKLCYASTVTTTTYGGPIGTRMFVLKESDPSDVQTYMTYLFEPEESPDLPALSGVMADFEGDAPSFKITGFDGSSDNGGKAEIAEGMGLDGSNALAAYRTTWTGSNNTEIIWDIADPGTVGENKYLVVWMDMSTNDIDFRKAGFGLLANNVNDNPYRTDNHDDLSPFYYKAEGSDEWITMSTGGDGCFGADQDSSVKGYKGWFAFPLEYMIRRGGVNLQADTAVTGIYFYFSPSESSELNKPVYIDNIQLVADYHSVNQ